MSSLEQAQQRFAKAMDSVEQALDAARQRQNRQNTVTRELAELQSRYAALEAKHTQLQKSYDSLRRQQQAAAKRLDGTISSLREVLNA